MLTTATQVSSLLLVVTFAWASAAKVLRWRRWRDALARYRLGGALERVALVGVPVAEALVVVLLVMGLVKIGAALVMALISAFSLAVVRARGFEGDRLPCGCFGRATARDYREMLVRNALLAFLAAVVLLIAVVAGARNVTLPYPSGGDVVPAALVVAGLAVGVWLLRQVNVSLRRRT